MPAAKGRSTLVIVALVALFSGCATSALKLGQGAELRQDYDQAVVDYTNALRKHPNDRAARQGLERSKLRSSIPRAAKSRQR